MKYLILFFLLISSARSDTNDDHKIFSKHIAWITYVTPICPDNMIEYDTGLPNMGCFSPSMLGQYKLLENKSVKEIKNICLTWGHVWNDLACELLTYEQYNEEIMPIFDVFNNYIKEN